MNGLVPVDLVENAAGKFRVIESIGGYDRTEEFGAAIATGAASVLNGVTTAAYADGVLTITPAQGATPSLKNPSVLLVNDIPGIEWNRTVMMPSS